MESSQLDQLLKFLTETLQQGKDFTVEQAPKFVQELLYWRVYEAYIWIGVAVFVLVLGVLIGFFWGAFEDKGSQERLAARGLCALAGFVISFVMIAANVYTIVQVKVAPRVVLVEMVRDMISTRR